MTLNQLARIINQVLVEQPLLGDTHVAEIDKHYHVKGDVYSITTTTDTDSAEVIIKSTPIKN